MAEVNIRVTATYEVTVEAEYGDLESTLKAKAEEQVRDRLLYPDAVTSVVLRTEAHEAALLATQAGITQEEALAYVTKPGRAPGTEESD